MSTETKVDVLAGLKLAAADRHAEGNTAAANELLEIVSAVGELIEAMREIVDEFGNARPSKVRMAEIAEKALARVGGAS